MTGTSTHVIETCVRSRIDGFGDYGDYLYRELSERDYGVDAIMNVLKMEFQLVKLAFYKLKGRAKRLLR